MKKLIFPVAVALVFVACSGRNDTDAGERTTTTTTSTTTTDERSVYTPTEGDVTVREGKVMVMRNGNWIEADQDVRLENDVIVVTRERKVRRDNVEVDLNEGEVVNRSGNFFDRSGRAIENAWAETKQGAREAGREVKEAANEVGKEAEDAVDGNK